MLPAFQAARHSRSVAHASLPAAPRQAWLILIGGLYLFITEKLRIDITAMLILAALVFTGVLDSRQALSGFSSEPAIIVVAVFVISGALGATGISERLGLPERIEDLPRRLSVVASDLATGGEYWFTEGPLADAVRSSVAIPAVFSPRRVGDCWLVDGALVDPLPITGCRRMGARRVIAVNANATLGKPLWQPRPQGPGMVARLVRPDLLPAGIRSWAGWSEDPDATEPPPPEMRDPGFYEVMMTSLDILCEGVLKHRLDLDPPDLMIDLDLRHVGVLELHRAAEAIEAGEAAVEAQADEILDLIAEDAGPQRLAG